MPTIKLTSAQISALECAGLDFNPESQLALAWVGTKLVFSADMKEALLAELADAENAEDAVAEGEGPGDCPIMARQARGARTALENIDRKVRAAIAHG